MSKILLFKAFIKKEFALFRRYFVNSIGGMLTLYIIFLLLFAGYRGIAGGADFGNTLEGLVVGYIVWVLMLSTYQDLAYTLQNESREGTLEQLYMSVHGFGWVMGAKVFAGFFTNMVMIIILLVAVTTTTGTSLNIDVISLLPVLLLTLLGILGIGFVIGGITLVLKRIESFTQIVQFVLIALVSVPAGRVWWLRLLPGSYGASLVNRVMVDNAHILDFVGWELLLLAVLGLAHLFLGYQVYRFCERKAMSAGLLGHY